MTKTETSKSSLKVSRIIKAPREKLYAMFLDGQSPEMEHFAPSQSTGKRMRLKVHTLEPKVGGKWRLGMIADEGDHQGTFTAYGTYLELVSNERIVQTHAWEPDNEFEEPGQETKVTITFRDVQGGTEVTIVHEGLPGPEAVEGHLGGWTQSLENLAEVF